MLGPVKSAFGLTVMNNKSQLHGRYTGVEIYVICYFCEIEQCLLLDQ